MENNNENVGVVGEGKETTSKTTLTDQQVEQLNKSLEEVDGYAQALKSISDNIEDVSSGKPKKVKVTLNPNTGEQMVSGTADEDNTDFEDIVDRINSSDLKLDESPITEEEMRDYIKSDEFEQGVIGDVVPEDFNISPDGIRKLLEIVNRKDHDEKFNAYREFPDEVKALIDKYMLESRIPAIAKEYKVVRNMISEQLLEEFSTNISIDRIKHDFNKELEDLFKESAEEITDSVVGYTSERNKNYREYAEKIDDEEKKEKMLTILNFIDLAYSLDSTDSFENLKDFSKRCKIKKYELERSDKVFNDFLRKYKDSSFNIYDINMCRPILNRHLPDIIPDLTISDIDAFLVCFCKRVMNMSPENVNDHAYMYYFLYNICLIDINTGKNQEISTVFLNNIKECIENLRKRNNNFK